jgi:hypothetical protein
MPTLVHLQRKKLWPQTRSLCSPRRMPASSSASQNSATQPISEAGEDHGVDFDQVVMVAVLDI